ncbi:hypothetical protein BS50DRAFT_640895 [Corynespora cassiicola Philippines]|uniref:Uncharacterized protein n=1 Tax=Corynespora cassiicola Philippines TaxID=1448308 RepID=A0A2T2N2S1_CORCC|nr:hypothetical protein BS50DRAFT_640895 [Corynespora cassiicola Philippines]
MSRFNVESFCTDFISPSFPTLCGLARQHDQSAPTHQQGLIAGKRLTKHEAKEVYRECCLAGNVLIQICQSSYQLRDWAGGNGTDHYAVALWEKVMLKHSELFRLVKAMTHADWWPGYAHGPYEDVFNFRFKLRYELGNIAVIRNQIVHKGTVQEPHVRSLLELVESYRAGIMPVLHAIIADADYALEHAGSWPWANPSPWKRLGQAVYKRSVGLRV